MLNIKESINLIGESKIKKETGVYITATVTTDSSGTPTVVTNVLNEELYKGNRKQYRNWKNKFELVDHQGSEKGLVRGISGNVDKSV